MHVRVYGPGVKLIFVRDQTKTKEIQKDVCRKIGRPVDNISQMKIKTFLG